MNFNCFCIKNKLVFCSVFPELLEVDPKSKDSVLTGDAWEDYTEDYGESNAEITVMQKEAKEGQQPLEGGRGKDGFVARPLRGAGPCQYLDFRFLVPRMGGNRLLCF